MNGARGLQAVVFFLVATSFLNVYITQPVLPVLQQEFGADEFQVSLTISAVVLGIALANLPFGVLADRVPVHRLLLTGGVAVCTCSLVAAATHDLRVLVAARFVQGLFLPALTTCLAAYLSRSLPADRLNVVMGSYVSATVAGGLGGRLLGGWLHPPAHWRYAFVTAGLLLLAATIVAAVRLREKAPAHVGGGGGQGFIALLRRGEVLRILLVAFGAFFVFSSVFNYMPFHLAAPPLQVPTEQITAVYLAYIIGIFIGPVAGGLSNRYGNGATLAAGSALLAASLLLTLVPSVLVIAAGLAGVCAGYFAVHAAAVGALNRKLDEGRGRANALYVLFYYLGGWAGISLCGYAWVHGGWTGVLVLCLVVLCVPFVTGLLEHRAGRARAV